MYKPGKAPRCEEPASFYLVGVALRSFFLVLATHLLAGEVDTTLGQAPFRQRLSWWLRYYNPLNLSWRYYSMFAYRVLARCWGADQLVLINHEEHPFLPPLPYIVGETLSPLRLRRLEMAGLLSSQGILTFSAAYQGVLAIQYTISTEGIPYLPNVTVPLAMVGLFRVLACKWVANKVQVDPYPHPCFPAPPPQAASAGIISRLWPFARKRKRASYNADPLPTALCTMAHPSTDTDPSLPSIHRYPLSVRLPSHPNFILTSPSTSSHYLPAAGMQSSISLESPKLSWPFSTSLASSLSESLRPSPRKFFSAEELLSSRAYSASFPPSKVRRPPSLVFPADISKAAGRNTSLKLVPARVQPISPSDIDPPAEACQAAQTYDPPFDYKSNKLVVGLWSAVLVALVTMSGLPYKVAAAYTLLPRTRLQFSMQIFYQYIAVTEFFFHGYLLLLGPRALANRVLFFDHWVFKVQTVGFYILLTFMLVVAIMDFVRHGYYRECA